MTLAVIALRDQAIVNPSERDFVIVAEGGALVWAAASQARKSQEAAEESAIDSRTSADAAEVAASAVGVFPSTNAGISSTSDGDTFYVAEGGTIKLYLNDGGVAAEQAEVFTMSLATSSGGSVAVGYKAPFANSVLRSVSDRLSDSISVLDADGADPTGANDSSDAFIAALSQGDVRVPPGLYKITKPLSVASQVLDLTSATLLCEGWTGGTGTASGAGMILLGDGAKVVGGTLDGNDEAGQGFRIAGSGVTVSGTEVCNFLREGARVLAGSSNVEFKDVGIHDIGMGQPSATVCNGIYITGDASEDATKTTDVRVIGGSIRDINYSGSSSSETLANDANGVQVLGSNETVVLNPDDPSFSNSVTNVLVDGTDFARIDRRSVKIQSSFVSVINTTNLLTGGIRVVGGGKKITGVLVQGNRLTECPGFFNGGAMLLDSVFDSNVFEKNPSVFWRASDSGIAVRCVITNNIVDMDGENSALYANCIYVGGLSRNGFYDRDLHFSNNVFRRVGGNSSVAANDRAAVRVQGDEPEDVYIGGNVFQSLPESPGFFRIRGTRTVFVDNKISPLPTAVTGTILLESTSTVLRSSSPPSKARGSLTIAEGAVTGTMTHNLGVFGSSGAGAVFTTLAAAFPTPARDAVRFSIVPINAAAATLGWAITSAGANSAVLTIPSAAPAGGLHLPMGCRGFRMTDPALNRSLGRMEATMDAIVKQMAEMKTEMVKLREAQEADKSELAALKNKGTGLAIGLALACGTAGAGISKLISHLTGA